MTHPSEAGPKYQPLADFLAASPEPSLTLSFRQIALIIGDTLPPTATRPPHQHTWWSNNPRNSPQTQAWLGVGWRRGRLDRSAETITFEREHEE